MPKKIENPDDLLLKAFKRLDDRIKKEKEDLRRSEELEKYKIRQLQEEKQRKRREQIIYLCVGLFLTSIVYGIYQVKDKPALKNMIFARMGLVRNPVDCSNPNNWKAEICKREKREKMEATWEGMLLNKNSKARPFAVHEENKDK